MIPCVSHSSGIPSLSASPGSAPFWVSLLCGSCCGVSTVMPLSGVGGVVVCVVV